MKAAVLLLVIAGAGCAQDGAVERGARLYRSNCAIPYCHGPEGNAGRAPRLIGHHYNVNSMFKVISWGIPGTGMPQFTTLLKTEEMADLVAYVMTLSGSTTAPAPTPVAAPRALSPQAKEGRALFFDATRTGACGSCHDLDGWGVAVGPDLALLAPDRIPDLRNVATRRVVTAKPASGEAFPALLVERTETRVRVYDLTAPLPVLRSFASTEVTIAPGSRWRHEQASRIYSSGELGIIAGFLRWRLSQ